MSQICSLVATAIVGIVLVPSRGPAQVVAPKVRAACDLAYSVAAKTPGVKITRRTGNFRDETLRKPVFGCGLAVAGSFAKAGRTGDAATRLRDRFAADAWREIADYSADGSDGTSFAFEKSGVACLTRGSWNGGADDEPETPREDWYKVTVFCTSPPFPERRP